MKGLALKFTKIYYNFRYAGAIIDWIKFLQGAGYEYSTDNRRQEKLYGYAADGRPAGGYD
ncbi:hypothetical protein CE91St59_16330 [[Clostridium] scindens]|nr:hypothetical protein CE91St59_16330 [[Clostridium] scindens]BDF20068.1 hypothetical protein CE91St60_16510 [[Clostridium] scindens]